MAGPFRDTACADRVSAVTRDGQAVLEVAPEHVSLELGVVAKVAVTDTFLTVVRPGRRRPKRRSHRIGGPVVVARAWPTRDVALWRELRPGVVERVIGLRPLELLDERGLAALRDLERLAGRLSAALADRAGGVTSATEYGRGQHRVLELRSEERLVLYARPVFRERPRRAIEVCADGSLVVPTRRGDKRARVRDRYGVILSGDRIRFCERDGRDLADVFLPWIAPEDREEITRRVQRLIDGGAPPPAPQPELATAWLGTRRTS